MTLFGEIGRNYITLFRSQAERAASLVTIGNLQKDYQLANLRVVGGAGTQAEVLQAESAVKAAQATLPTFDATIEVSINALSVLCGLPPQRLGIDLHRSEE